MSGIIRRAAKAQADLIGPPDDHPCKVEVSLGDYRRARAAIRAIREPTDSMIAAGFEAMGAEGAHDCEVSISDIWRAMIDAVLRD